MRTWTSEAGTSLEAKLLEETDGSVRLQRKDGSELTVHLGQLSQADVDYVSKATEVVGETKITGLDAEPGKISSQITCIADRDWHYYLYLPKSFHDVRKWPVWFIMSPDGGNDPGSMRRYIDGAERLGCILAFSVESKNNFADSDLAIEAMVEDVYDRLPVAEDLAFATGFSGGSRMAYLLAERERNVAGVLACGSGNGVYIKEEDFRNAKLRRSTYVYSLMGNKCFNLRGALQSHNDFPDDYRLRIFPGGHDWAQAGLIAEGMARVLGAGLENYHGEGAKRMRTDYAKTMWAWTLEMIAKQPWEAHYWAEFLKEFPRPKDIQGEAADLASKLKSMPKVELARKAEREILDFADKFFRNKEPNKGWKDDAQRLAEKYSEIPHGDIFRSLEDPD